MERLDTTSAEYAVRLAVHFGLIASSRQLPRRFEADFIDDLVVSVIGDKSVNFWFMLGNESFNGELILEVDGRISVYSGDKKLLYRVFLGEYMELAQNYLRKRS